MQHGVPGNSPSPRVESVSSLRRQPRRPAVAQLSLQPIAPLLLPPLGRYSRVLRKRCVGSANGPSDGQAAAASIYAGTPHWKDAAIGAARLLRAIQHFKGYRKLSLEKIPDPKDRIFVCVSKKVAFRKPGVKKRHCSGRLDLRTQMLSGILEFEPFPSEEQTPEALAAV